MGVDEVWRARLDAPHPKSYLAFILGCHAEVERIDGPPPLLWTGPIDLSKVPRAKQAYWKHWNPTLIAFEDAMRTAVNDRLARVLRPGLSCSDPEVKPLADTMLEGHRAALIAEDALATARSEPILARYPIKPIWAFVFFVKADLRLSMPTASENAVNKRTADYLSHGIPSGQARKYALNRNHVDRACRRFLANLMGRVNSAHTKECRDQIINATFVMWNNQLDTIERIAKEASASRAFPGKTGAELVAAIDQSNGVHRTYYQLIEREHPKVRA